MKNISSFFFFLSGNSHNQPVDYSATVKGSGETENLFRSTVFDAAVRIDLELSAG